MSRKVHLIALALVAAAVAAPVAHAADRPDDRAGMLGVGLASQPAPRSEAADPRPTVDPLAVSYLRGQGLSPREVSDWTVGACSQRAKPMWCFSALERTTASVQGARSSGVRSSRFHWADAGIGAGATLGIVLMLAGFGAALVIVRQNRGPQAPGM